MAEITRLVEILRAERDSARKDRLRLDSIKPGLQRFNCIVRFGTVDSGDGKIQLEHWSREQIETVLAIARLIVFSSVSATVEQVDPTVVAVIESTIEFCICLLERSECDDDDLSLQNEVVLFLEATLTESIVQNLDGLCDHLFDDFLKSLPDSPNDTGHLICNNPECHWQDSTCLNNKNPMKRVIVSLATECLQAETPVSGFAGRPSSQLPNDIITLVKHFGVVHAKCLPRLLLSSIKLLEFRASSEEMSMKNCFNRRSSFIIRVLKVLGILTRDIPYIPFDFDLMNAVIHFGDSLVALFRNEFEFIYSDVVTSTDTLDNQLLVLLEEFIQLVKIVFCDGSIFWNIQMCVIAKMLDILDSKVWRYNSLASCLRTPLAYSPKVIMYLVKLIKDVKCQTKTFMWNEKFGTNPTGFSFISKIEGSIPSWNILSEKVNLLKKCTPDEHLGLLFSPSKHWLDDFINLAYFFHSEGIKLRLKMNGVRSSPTKSVNSDADSTLIHEDEALFGDLFSEANRSVGPDSRLEQTDIDCSSSTYSNQHMLTHVATELLVFLKVCCFNPEWSRDVYEIACRMFNENHVNYLTSILSCRRYPIDGSARNTALCSQVDVLNINQVCFELLYNLVVQNVLSSALEEHFVDQVLRIENGKYVYNEYSLTLLAHVLFARDGSSVSQLTTKVYENFVNFIMEKSTSSLSNYVDLKDFVGFLPCVFHLELLLMAFHLSNDSEKARIASYVFHSLKGLSAPPAEYSAQQLSLWGLLASRLVLIVHHFVLYPSGCPPWLYVKFRSTLSEAPPRVTIYNHPNDHPASWTMTAAVGIMGDQMKDLPVTSILFPYLIDFSLFSSTAYADDEGFQNLGLSCTDILTSFAWLLCFWSGKKADMLEDLIIERYVFLLCWDTFSIACSRVGDTSLLHIDSSKDDSLSTKCFFLFGQLLLRNNSIVHEDLLPRVVNDLFQQVHCIKAANDTARQGWDMLRNGAWLSLVLSLLHSGLWVSSVKKSVCDVEPYVVEPLCRNKQFLILAESAIEIVLLNNQGRWLVDILSSCLKMSLQAFQEAFICIFDDRQTFGRGFSPCLLLKHTVFDRNRQDELLEKCGYNSSKLDSVLSLLSKLEEISKEGNNRSIISSVSRSLLHGFPSHPQTSSATLVSSALNVQDIVCVLDCLFNLKGAGADVTPEKDSSHLLWQLVMKVKSDMCFQNIHEKCEAILSNLYTPMDKQLDYGHLFQLKQIEGFLRDITSEDVSDFSTLEMLVIQATESIEALRRDQSREKTFTFYLGATGASEEDELLSSSHHGDLLVMINALDQCPSESINIKVLNFFVDLLGSSMPCPRLNDRVLEKFISFDLTSLSKWLEVRLLGNTLEESGKGTLKATSSSLREATMTFLTCLVSLPCEALSEEFHQRLVDAMLVHLDCAFIKYDIYTAKSYFNFIIQLVNGKPMLKNLLEVVILLIQNLAEHEASQQALKFLIGFLGIVLQDCGATKNILGKHPGKLLATLSSASEGCRQLGSKKNTETLVLSASQEAGSVSIDCDATSVDEDEEDGTSDGELASIDKDEEDNNSEKTLASKVCTFTSSGSNFMEQHWYFCYTCDLTVSKGCCSVCAKVCHRSHRVVYSRFSRFFCDCGAGGVRGNSCQCLKPRKFTGSSSSTSVQSSNTLQTFLPLTDDGEEAPDSDSDLEDDHYADIDGSLTFSVPKMVQDGIVTLLQELCVEDWLLQLCDKLLPLVFSRRDAIISKDRKIVLEGDKVLSHKVDIFQLKKAYKSGSFDLKIRADYSNSRELKGHITSGSLTKSLLTVSSRGRLAVAEGDKVSIFDVGQLIGQSTATPVVADKSNIKHLSKNIVRFEIVHLLFNNIMENYLVVAGYAECQVLTVNPRGEVTDRLAIELALQGAYIRRVDWVPGSQVQLLVVTNMFIKIYDLSQDNISPIHYFTLADDSIVDATLIVAPMGRLFLIVLSEVGNLFRLELSVKGDVGAKLLEEIVEVPKRGTQAKGHSLYFSPSHRLLFLSYQDGTTLIGRFDTSATLFTEISALYENENDGKLRPAALHHWNDLLVDNGLFVSFSSLKQNAAVAISLHSQELFAQNMRHTGGSPALQLVGITAYKPLSKDKAHCLVLQEDGSLQIYLHTPFGADASLSMSSDLGKRIGVGILSNKAYAGTKPEFPLDFFEKTTCITTDIKLSGEAIKNSDSEGAKQKLTSDEGFLESPSPAGFKITVLNSNPDIVMVGFRLHVGNTSASHIPSAVTVFQRVIKLDEGMRSWYDIPFTIIESLVADEEFTITVSSTFNGSTSPRIDCLEVYGRAKDEFGWKEKMDAFLDMEADMLGSNSGTAGTKKRYYPIKNSPIEEQLLADALKLLSKIYFLRGPHTCLDVEEANLELNELKCKKILEMIFEGDREAFLQSAACQVLQALFPKKEIYYHVKDTMRLFGVLRSSPTLVSKLGISSSAASWVIKYFIAKTRTVTKIALLRRPNLASFLETNGSGVVDGLMQVFWGILDYEQSDTQIINSIVIPCVELIYSYAECIALSGLDASGSAIIPAVRLLKELLFAPYEAVQTSSSLAISSRLLQVPFPKQMMLGTEEVAKNPSTLHMHPDVASHPGRNAQVVTEDDSTMSSVQYCCDGCSTVPILRRRWHCNVCPDFDLCEACYEVMDADRLPPPHSSDHHMSAIPIENDNIGGDSSEFRFSLDELNDANLAQFSEDTRQQNALTPAHTLESSETGEFPASAIVHSVVSISASKRAVNSLLLRQLIYELRGWMKTTSGTRAIPLMQFFYRISSAVGGPFMDSSKPENLDLEKFVKWFLDEIDLNKPFLAKSRTFFGETSILVFMFLTLMLRNWHQPGSDSSQLKSDPATDTHDKGHVNTSSSFSSLSSKKDHDKDEFASQLARACSYLRQQALVNYLMDILQQLVPHFKFSDTNAEGNLSLPSNSGCGSLLVVRRELPAGNFSPFFSDSYAKAHRSDLFVDFYKLLLENTFRLLYSLVRPEKHEKSVEKDKGHKTYGGKDLKLDGYQDVLCSYISNQHTVFVRRYARRLFLHLCGSKSHYYSVRDSWQISNEVKKLYKLVDKSGGFQNAVPYERSVKLVKCLSAIAEIAGARPRNWQKYCSKHGDFLCFIMEGIFHLGEETVVQTLKLLNFALFSGKDTIYPIPKPESRDAGTSSSKVGSQSSDSKKKKKGEDGNEANAIDKCLDMEHAVEIFFPKGGENLKLFIDTFLLEWNSTSVRMEAKCVLYGAWNHSKRQFRETLVSTLLEKIKVLPMYGQNIVEYTELLSLLLEKVLENAKQQDTEMITQCLTPDVINSICKTLHLQNELLANHPNSRIYNTLSSLVEFDGYYLESEPCVACSCPEVPYSRMKLETLKFETKFTDNRIIVKCTGSYTIQSMIMNVHDARKSKAVKVLNLYYNNRPVSDLSELKNNWSLWKRAKSCHLTFNQTELKVDFPIPITACNFMIELDSFYENLQASSQEALQCPRCSRSVTDKHGICSNCHENAYQCRQCRNINYENLDSFLCNECGYSKYGRFEFNFMARPSFLFDSMENDDDMKKGLAAIESESENAHRRYQQLMGFKKPLLKLVSSIGEQEIDSQHKDTVQQMMVSMPGPSCKINRKIALLGVLYGEKCKATFDSLNKSVQTLQGLRRVLMNYLQQKRSGKVAKSTHIAVSKSSNNCYGCAITFVSQCMELLRVLSKHPNCKKQFVTAGILSELFENNIHQGPKSSRAQARVVLCAFSEGDSNALAELNSLIQKKVMYCLEHHRSMDISVSTREELFLLSEVCAVVDEFWEARLRVAFHLLFASIRLGSRNPAISEQIILPCLRIISQVCNPPKTETHDKEQVTGRPVSTLQSKSEDPFSSSLSPIGHGFGTKTIPEYKSWDGFEKGQEISLMSYSEWVKGASYLDFIRRHYKIAQNVKSRTQRVHHGSHRSDYLALKYGLKWKRTCSKRTTKSGLTTFELGSWVSELVLSPCSQSIRAEVCGIISLLYTQNAFRQFQLLNLLMLQLPDTLAVGESSAEYFELFSKMLDSHTARLFLTAKGCLATICRLITQEVGSINSQEASLNIDISQGFVLNKLVELLTKFLEVSIIRQRFMREELLSQVLESLLVIRGLIVQKTKLISDCTGLLKDLLNGLLVESSANKRQFIRACVSGLQIHGEEKEGRTCLFILEQLCNLICPSKPEPVYLLILNKAHTQEEFIRGSMTKNPYSSIEIGPLMRDIKNKICHQLDLLGLVEDDYGMELLVAGNIISLDLTISQVYEQVWKKCQNQTQSTFNNTLLTSGGLASSRDCSPMTITYRLQGLDGEATEPMIKELEEEREESQDPEVEFAIAGAVREFGGLEIILSMIQNLRDDELKSNQEELSSVLNLLMYCCKIRENRRALLRMGALGLLLEIARRAFSVDAMEPAEGILLIVESLTVEANESDMGTSQSVLAVGNEEAGAGEQAKKIVLMFLERLCHSSGLKKSNKQQRNDEMVARILPCLTYGEPAAMDALIQHFDPYLHDWVSYDQQQKKYQDNAKDENLVRQACQQKSEVENFVRVSESLNTSSCGERLKDIILHKGISAIAVGHLRQSFAFIEQPGFKTSAEWKYGLSLPSVPVILPMLRGLARGHLATQRLIDDGGILPLLHALEGVSGENGIGAMAENLLDTLSDKENNGDGFLGSKVLELRHATRNEMRQRALRKREEMLQVLGMRQELSSDGGERIVLAKSSIEGLEDVIEEEIDGLACMVCREGYTLRPNDMLGVYSFSKRVNLGAGSSGSTRGECVYTTVSHFNIIHFQCHQEAKRADAALKNPKKEWEGATLRNNETLCNCIFPLRGPSVPISQYIRCVDLYWDNLNVLGRADGSRLRLLTYDIVLMLARFATGASFSADSKGGGKESNSRLLPFMIQMACYLLDQGNSSQQRQSMAKSISAYLSPLIPGTDSPSRSTSFSAGRASSGSSDDTVQFMMVNSLLSESYDEWSQHLSIFLQRGIYHAYMQHTHGRSTLRVASDVSTSSNKSTSHSGTQPADSSKLFSIIQPMLVYTGLIEQMQRFFKVSKSNSPASAKESEVGSSTVSLEKWEVLMRERLLNMKEMLGLSKELLAWLDDMTTAVDLQEAFDIMGALGVVFSGGFSTCNEFVQAAIDSGKN